MTKQEAIALMKQGIKMTHRFFSPEEWVYIGENGKYVLEDGAQCREYEFWHFRRAIFFNDGWERWEK